MTTKVDRINGAYSQLRISGLTVNPTPEDLQLALDRLESMMHEWQARNMGVGYFFEDSPDPNTASGVDRKYWQAIETCLAVRLCADFNKTPSPFLVAQANQSASFVSSQAASSLIKEVPYPNRQPRGSGNSGRYNRWQRYYRDDVSPPTESSTNQIYIGDINDYTESFNDYLSVGETVSSYTAEADPGLTLSNDSISGNDIVYRIEAVDNATQGSYQQVKISITTSTGRKQTRLIDFDVISPNTVGSNA